MKVGDEVRIKSTWDTGIILAKVDGKFRVRCDCGMTWHYSESALEPLTRAKVT